MKVEKLYKFLRELPLSFMSTDHVEYLITDQIYEFISLLGYTDSQLFYGVNLSSNGYLLADAVIANDRTARPWILIESKLYNEEISLSSLLKFENQLKKYASIANPEYSVLFSPYFLIIVSEQGTKSYNLSNLTLEQASEIYNILKKSNELPTEPITKQEYVFEKIESETFNIDLKEYSEKLDRVFAAETNDEKKKSLEGLAKLLFEGIPFLSCKYLNLRTISVELDLIVEYKGSENITIFDEFGRYFFVECKNWKKSVGVEQVNHFIGKLEKSKLKLGILIAKNGISGVDKGKDAIHVIRSVFDSKGIYVLVISKEDLVQIKNGISFYNILDKKIDELKFDVF